MNVYKGNRVLNLPQYKQIPYIQYPPSISFITEGTPFDTSCQKPMHTTSMRKPNKIESNQHKG